MAEVKLTAAQQAVVDHRGGALLVAAAAGSGKTKVLVDRLLRQICDKDNPKNIQDFLIITYTKAAASELQQKIAKELGKLLVQHPHNVHLQRQITYIYGAEISTIHSFCGNLLRSYGHFVDLPSDFRVVEEAESVPLRDRVWQEILERAYEGDMDDDRRALLDNLGFGRDDRRVTDGVMTLYHGANCHPNPGKWMDLCCEKLDISQYGAADQTPWGAYLLERFHEDLKAYQTKLDSAIDEIVEIPDLLLLYYPQFDALRQEVKALLGVEDWQTIFETLPRQFERLRAARGFDDKFLLDRLKGARTAVMDGLKAWGEIFYGPSQEALEDLTLSAQALRGGFSLVRQLMDGFGQEKRRRKMVDFGDLEHLTIGLLVDETTGEPTAVARDISQRYTEIMVDEYQDSNEIQDQIFRAISKNGENRFMVGDVKQSIYRFRLADPTIFLEKYHAYELSSEVDCPAPRKILLSENFRSHQEILAAVNHVFRAVMSPKVGDLAYTDQEALKVGVPFPALERPGVELHVMAPMDDLSKQETEARFVATRIANMIAEETLKDGRKIEPRDIVILLRSVGGVGGVYRQELARLGIPSVSDRGGSILETKEVETLISLLEVLDNPHGDVALVAVLTSPLFGFTAQELADLRLGHKDLDFYDTLVLQGEQSPKVAEFLTDLEGWREQSRWLSLGELMQHLLTQTKAQAVFGAMDQGAQRMEHIRYFVEYATSFGSGEQGGLFQFCTHLRQLEEQNMSLGAVTTSGVNGVTLMSIHKSKGLEFPVVFLADLSHKFNQADLQKGVMTHPKLFAASNVLDTSTHVRFPTIGKKAMAKMMAQENMSEELRVLYVAMTRPQERLVMSYCSKYVVKELENISQACTMPLSPDFAGQAKSLGSWVLAAAMTRTEAGQLFEEGGYPGGTGVYDFPWDIQFHTELPQAEAVELTQEETKLGLELPTGQALAQEFSYVYPHLEATSLPTKITPTQLKGRSLDQEVVEAATEVLPKATKSVRRPRFATSRGLTAAERGTANHLFLQFARYENCTDLDGVNQEVRRLVDGLFLTQEQGEAILQVHMVNLFQSEFGQAILNGSARRELKFSLLVDAPDLGFPVAEEKILLQGVVDCLLETAEGLVIIDFKTDQVAPGQEQDRAQRYLGQVDGYSLALSRMFQRPVAKRMIYFLATQVGVEL